MEGSDEYKGIYYSIKYPICNLEKTLDDHTSWVNSAKFSPDGTKVITALCDNTAKIWKTLY